LKHRQAPKESFSFEFKLNIPFPVFLLNFN